MQGDKAVSRGANSVCQEQVSFVIEDAEISSKTDSLSIEELESVLETLDNTLTPHVRLQVRGERLLISSPKTDLCCCNLVDC